MTQSSVKDAHNIFDQSLYLFYLYCCVSTMEEKPFLEYIERGASNIIQFLSFYFVSVLLYIYFVFLTCCTIRDLVFAAVSCCPAFVTDLVRSLTHRKEISILFSVLRF
jgi:hypothetical protein